MATISFDLELALSVARTVLIVVAFAGAAFAFTRWRKSAQQDAECITTQLTAITERLGEIEAGLAWLDSRVSEVSRQLDEPSRNQTAVKNSAAPSYPIAIRLARNGANCEELMENCKLTRQEAELVKRLHGPSKRTTRAQNAAA
jgi:hypothetical protein